MNHFIFPLFFIYRVSFLSIWAATPRWKTYIAPGLRFCELGVELLYRRCELISMGSQGQAGSVTPPPPPWFSQSSVWGAPPPRGGGGGGNVTFIIHSVNHASCHNPKWSFLRNAVQGKEKVIARWETIDREGRIDSCGLIVLVPVRVEAFFFRKYIVDGGEKCTSSFECYFPRNIVE